MAIQFRCPSCRQPIEVDDEFRGQPAACPYCRRVVTVPAESELAPAGVVVARPANPEVSGGALSTPHAGGSSDAGSQSSQERSSPTPVPAWRNYGTTPPPLPPTYATFEPPPEARALEKAAQQRAATYGNYALVCGALTMMMYILLLGTVWSVFGSRYMALATQPTRQAISPEQLEADLRAAPGAMGRLLAFQIGAFFFGVFAAGFSIASLRSRNNWRGWTGIAMCAPMFVCTCAGVVLQVLSG